jgi:hypothetical protein
MKEMTKESLHRTITKDKEDFFALVKVRCEYYRELDRIKCMFNANDDYVGMLKIQKLTKCLSGIKL